MAKVRGCCLVFATGRCGTVYLSYLLRVLGQDGRLILHEEPATTSLRHLLGAWGVVVASHQSSLHYVKGLAELRQDKDVDLKLVVLARELVPNVLSWLRHSAKLPGGGRQQVTRWAAMHAPIAFNKAWTACQMFIWNWFATYVTVYKLRDKGDACKFFRFDDLNSIAKLNELLVWMGGFAPVTASVLARVKATAQYAAKQTIEAPDMQRELRGWVATLSASDRRLVEATGKWLIKNGVISQHPQILLGE